MSQILSEQEFKDQVVSLYTDVVGEKVGGSIVNFSDEWFAAAENLIKPKAPIRDATKFVYSGAWYDGWETRRHNTEEADWVTIKFGVIEKTECGPSQRHFFKRSTITEKSYTHARLKQYPDGGIARFRLYGEVVPHLDSIKANSIIDLASVGFGGVAVKCSDQHFGSADNLLLPGRGHDMSDGWETKRSRQPGHVDWVIIKLGAKTNINEIVIDTAHFRGNFPQKIAIDGLSTNEVIPTHDDSKWVSIIKPTKTTADKEHSFTDLENIDQSYTHVKLTIIPDGGVKRVRVLGTIAK
ncbi:unnamed protein product [Wickerhamomyces anomalus]